MRTCANCQATNEPDFRFCKNCGTPIDATQVKGNTLVYEPNSIGVPSPVIDTAAIIACTRSSFANSASLLAAPPVANPAADQIEDTMLTMDVSASMGEEFAAGSTKLEAARRAGVNLVIGKHRIDPRDRIGVVAFDHTANLVLRNTPLATGKPKVISAIQSLSVGGGTDISQGLKCAERAFKRSDTDVVQRIVLLTDGHGGQPMGIAKRLKERGVVIDVIGIGPSPDEVNEELLKGIASVVDGRSRYRFIRDTETLVQHYTQLAGKTQTCK